MLKMPILHLTKKYLENLHKKSNYFFNDDAVLPALKQACKFLLSCKKNRIGPWLRVIQRNLIVTGNLTSK